jgi:hypothetical protein
MPIKVVIDFQARPGQRDELKNVLAGISAAHGPTAPEQLLNFDIADV